MRLALNKDDDALLDVVLAALPAPTRQTTIFQRQRPLAGGYEIGPRQCSLGVGIRRGAEQLAVTASHCTATIWSLDGGPLSQPLSGPSFGAEVTDPTPYTCATLFSPNRKCRRADIAAYDASGADLIFSDTLGWAPGLIARTQFASPGSSQANGSKDLDTTNPLWTVYAEVEYPLIGEVLHKIGWSTGWTYGGVYKSCVDTNQPNGSGTVRVVCADWAAMYT